MQIATRQRQAQARAAQKAASLRIALVLLSIAAVFFGGVILAQYSGAPGVGVGVLGFAVLVFLLVAIGRDLRK